MAIQVSPSAPTLPVNESPIYPGPSIRQIEVQPFRGMFIVVNGFPGTGTLTIMQHFQARLPAKRTRLIDNHLLIDPVHAIFPDRSDEYHALRRPLGGAYFKEVRKLVQKGFVILMIACLAEAIPRDAAVFQEHLDIVRGTDLPIFWINSYC